MKAPWESTRRAWWTPLLPLASWGYGIGIKARGLAYTLGLKRRQHVGVPVISVGNLTVGGTGKTPAVIEICRRLVESGHRPGVISRGYGGEKAQDEVIHVVPGETDWQRVGDEPLLIASSVPEASVYVAADRVAGARRAIAECRATVIVLDDGFQHWRLHRDLDIVLLDGTTPFGNGLLLPRGPLREPLAALHRADIVVITKINLAEEAGVWAQRISNRLHAPVVQAIHRPVRVWDIGEARARSIDDLRRQRVIAVCGLARNDTFPALLRSLGADIDGALDFDDHQVYGPEQWATIRRCLGETENAVLVTTAKDAVKWRAEDTAGLRAWVLEIGFDVTIGGDKLWRFVRVTAEGSV